MPFTSSSKSTKTMSSAASTISTSSTLKGTDSNKKWFSLPSKTTKTTESQPKSKSTAEKKAIHYEAVATYLALR
ncbi:uncharacterized protein N7511_000766 [Penicillium nucicola]|uniref:uncharacterized protein n=1 Tax=Penicillium nucicola TaxID=1850975 RepID=UPI0025451261|nr:uncharacterized protein N7511_000766 [Penicillium nucicola]KAJ5775755.1 hypothetical protein N7511_000766 [Penicillium nucicola]